MPTINCTIRADIVGAMTTAAVHTLEVEAYDVLEVTVPDAGSANLAIQPGAAGQVQLLLLTSSVYDAGLVYQVDASGTDIPLDAPLLLVGAGAAGILGAIQQIAFVNGSGRQASVRLLVGRDATP